MASMVASAESWMRVFNMFFRMFLGWAATRNVEIVVHRLCCIGRLFFGDR